MATKRAPKAAPPPAATLWAEWDPTTGNVVQIRNDDPQSGQLASGFTGADRTTGAKTEWYPLEVEYPEDYVPRFARLLGPGIMTLENGVVYQRFPQADFSEASVRDAVQDEIRHTTQSALHETDWYVIRHFETRQPIPEAVQQQRVRIRAQSEAKIQAVREVPSRDLLDFDTTLSTGDRAWTTPGQVVHRAG